MGFFDTAVDHFDQDIGVLMEFNHELLSILHLPESILIHNVSVMEKEVVFRCQLNLDVLNVVVVITLAPLT